MRYILLVLVNTPIILLALVNFITRYKLKKIQKKKFYQQIITWLILLLLLVASFPVYNLLVGKSILDSSELSLFDIAQTTAIIILLYIANNQRQKIDHNNKLLRDLHQEISIRLSRNQ